MKTKPGRTKKEIIIYDKNDTTYFIDKNKKLSLKDLGFSLPPESTTKVISIRLPTALYNALRAFSTNYDIPYQAYIKYLLAESIRKQHKPKVK
jgi:hypothetical protein